MKLNPIIAVKDVEASSAWYQSVFNWKSHHGGQEFEMLGPPSGEIVLCLHLWGHHEHPTMGTPSSEPGNGLILYFQTENMLEIHANLKQLNYPLEKDIHINENSHNKEFSFRDLDGYYITVTPTYALKG